MRQLFPDPVDDVDPVALHAEQARPAPSGRPWVMVNMIASLDGAISIEGVSGGLGGPADKQMFSAIRAVADVILVGAGTVSAENYRQPQTPDRVQAMRVARGQAPVPRLAIVTNALSITPEQRVFDSIPTPLILTSARAPADRRAQLAERAEILVVGEERVDVATAITRLGRTGAGIVLSEGGPTLNGALTEAGVVDELDLTLSPRLVGGRGPGIVAGAPAAADRIFRIDRILHADGLTFLRYLRD